MSAATDALPISARVALPLHEIDLDAVRSGGPGGQNVKLFWGITDRCSVVATFVAWRWVK
ncbi:MAG: hypothetical protein RBU21_15155 [FCB group bacterium]|jgi:hypothetical protein|nr:hypothetical protein [FCB group bacterium]